LHEKMDMIFVGTTDFRHDFELVALSN